jgi:CRISPR-associated protein Csb2
MSTVQLTFPWGRYYAHPWGINPTRLREPEWPPSPWRLLRGLVAAWFRAHPGQVPSAECVALVEMLGRELPEIGTSKVSFGQTVHWQPNFVGGDKTEASYKNTRHENHFAAVAGPVLFRWQTVTLTPEQRRLLELLLAELAYFGRAESLCHAELCESEPTRPGIGWCKDTGGRKISAACRDVFCPKPDDFRFTDLWSRRKDELAADCPDAPPHLVDRLLSTDMKADGADWRSYKMPEGWPHEWIVRTPRRQRAKPEMPKNISFGPKVAHYLSFSLQCRVPLLPKFTVPLSEQFRGAAGSILGDWRSSFALFGHPDDRPEDVKGDHQHAFYLPMPRKNDPHGFLSELHIWCPYGFTQAEIEILLRIQRLTWGSGRYPVRPVLTTLSKEPPTDAPFSTGKTAARFWRSASPFVPPRYFYRGRGFKMKPKEKDRPELQLAECLRAAGVQVAGEIRRNKPVEGAIQNGDSLWDIVRAKLGEETVVGAPLVAVPTHRNGSSSRRGMEQRVGGFFEVEFDEPVCLNQPALGHSCHFGLGLFVPSES